MMKTIINMAFLLNILLNTLYGQENPIMERTDKPKEVKLLKNSGSTQLIISKTYDFRLNKGNNFITTKVEEITKIDPVSNTKTTEIRRIKGEEILLRRNNDYTITFIDKKIKIPYNPTASAILPNLDNLNLYFTRESFIFDNYLTTLTKKETFATTSYINKRRYAEENLSTRNNYFFIGLNYTPSLNYRSMTINTIRSEAYESFLQRKEKELSTQGNNFTIQIGVTSGLQHHYYINLNRDQAGFQSYDQKSISWKSGLLTGGEQANAVMKFDFWGLGLGYKRVGYSYNAGVTSYLDISANYLRLFRYYQSNPEITLKSGNDLKKNYLKPNQLNMRLALGLAYRFDFRTDIHLAPSFSFNPASINKGDELKIRLFQLGLDFGFSYRFMSYKK